MSGDIHTSYDRTASGAGQKQKTWPVLAFVFSIFAVPAAAYGTYRLSEDYRKMWASGYSSVSFGENAGDICGTDYPVARTFTAKSRKGEAREGAYCASDLFGYKLVFGSDMAEATPPSP